MEEMDDQEVTAHRTVAAAAAIMADLGLERREHIVNADFKRYHEAQGGELEKLRASNKKGTKEWKVAQRNQGAINAWSNLWQEVDNPDLEEGEIPEYDGQTHRLRVRLELRGTEPDMLYGGRKREARDGGVPSGQGKALRTNPKQSHRPQFELPKLLGPTDKSAVVRAVYPQPPKPPSVVSSHTRSRTRQGADTNLQQGTRMPMLGLQQVSNPQSVQKIKQFEQKASGSTTPLRAAYTGSLVAGNDFLATAQNLFRFTAKSEDVVHPPQDSSVLQQPNAKSLASDEKERPLATEKWSPRPNLIDYASSSSSSDPSGMQASSANLADLSGLDIQDDASTRIDNQIEGAKTPDPGEDDFTSMNIEQLEGRKRKLVDGLYGVKTLLGLRPNDSHMQNMVDEIEGELTKVKAALTILTTPKASIPKTTPATAINITKRPAPKAGGVNSQDLVKKQPILILRADRAQSANAEVKKDPTLVEKQPTLVLRAPGEEPVRKDEPTKPPMFRQIGITGGLANSIHALVGNLFAPEPEKIPTKPRIGPHNLPNRNPSASKKLESEPGASDPKTTGAEKRASVSEKPKAIEVADLTATLTQSFEKFRLRSPSRSPPKKAAKLAHSEVAVKGLAVQPQSRSSIEPSQLTPSSTDPREVSSETSSPPSSRRSLFLQNCQSLSEVDRLFKGLNVASVCVLGYHRINVLFATHHDAREGFARSIKAKGTCELAPSIVTWDDSNNAPQGKGSSDATAQSDGDWLVQGIDTIQEVLEIIPTDSHSFITTVRRVAPSKHVVCFTGLATAISILNRLPPRWLQPPRSFGSELKQPYISWLGLSKLDESGKNSQDASLWPDKPADVAPEGTTKKAKSEPVTATASTQMFEGESYCGPGRSKTPAKSKSPKKQTPAKKEDNLDDKPAAKAPKSSSPAKTRATRSSKITEELKQIAGKVPLIQSSAVKSPQLPASRQPQVPRVSYAIEDLLLMRGKAAPLQTVKNEPIIASSTSRTQTGKKSPVREKKEPLLDPSSPAFKPPAASRSEENRKPKQAEKKPLLGAKSEWAPPSPQSKTSHAPTDKEKNTASPPPQTERVDTDPGWNAVFAKYKRPTKHELPAWLQQATEEQAQDHGAAVRRQYGLE